MRVCVWIVLTLSWACLASCGIILFPVEGTQIAAANAHRIKFTVDIVDEDGAPMQDVHVAIVRRALKFEPMFGKAGVRKPDLNRTVNGLLTYDTFGNNAVEVTYSKVGYETRYCTYSTDYNPLLLADSIFEEERGYPTINVVKEPRTQIILYAHDPVAEQRLSSLMKNSIQERRGLGSPTSTRSSLAALPRRRSAGGTVRQFNVRAVDEHGNPIQNLRIRAIFNILNASATQREISWAQIPQPIHEAMVFPVYPSDACVVQYLKKGYIPEVRLYFADDDVIPIGAYELFPGLPVPEVRVDIRKENTSQVILRHQE